MATASPSTAGVRLFTGDEVMRMVEAGILGENEKVELLDGRLWIVSPQGLEHGYVIGRLTMELARRCTGDLHVRPQCPLVAGELSLPEPDLAVVSLASIVHGMDVLHRHPAAAEALVVVEVVATRRRDARVKSPIYAMAGAPEYWIVDVPARAVDVHAEPGADGRWGAVRRFGESDRIPLGWADEPLPVSAVLPQRTLSTPKGN